MGTITKALDLLSYFTLDRIEIGLGEFVRLTGRDKATMHRHLSELAENGFLEQHPQTRAYRLGPACVRLAALREAAFPIGALLKPLVTELSAAVGELAHASLLQGNNMVPLVHADAGKHSVQVKYDPSEILPLHATASGLAALAFCPVAFQARVLDAPKTAFTDHTLSAPAALRRKLDEVRRFGIATSARAFDRDVTSIGAPVFEASGQVVAALAVAVPTLRAEPALLRNIAQRLRDDAARATTALAGTFPQSLAPLPDDLGAT